VGFTTSRIPFDTFTSVLLPVNLYLQSINFRIHPLKPHISAVPGTLFNLNAHCSTALSLWDEKNMHSLGQHCPTCPLKVELNGLKVKLYLMLKSSGGVVPCILNRGIRLRCVHTITAVPMVEDIWRAQGQAWIL